MYFYLNRSEFRQKLIATIIRVLMQHPRPGHSAALDKDRPIIQSHTKSYKVLQRFSIGTIPTDKMHPIGNAPIDKLHPVGTVPIDEMHFVGTIPLDKMHQIETIPIDKMQLVGPLIYTSYIFLN